MTSKACTFIRSIIKDFPVSVQQTQSTRFRTRGILIRRKDGAVFGKDMTDRFNNSVLGRLVTLYPECIDYRLNYFRTVDFLQDQKLI